MWDVGCGMWDVGCGMWDVGCGVWGCGMVVSYILEDLYILARSSGGWGSRKSHHFCESTIVEQTIKISRK